MSSPNTIWKPQFGGYILADSFYIAFVRPPMLIFSWTFMLDDCIKNGSIPFGFRHSGIICNSNWECRTLVFVPAAISQPKVLCPQARKSLATQLNKQWLLAPQSLYIRVFIRFFLSTNLNFALAPQCWCWFNYFVFGLNVSKIYYCKCVRCFKMEFICNLLLYDKEII